MVAESRIAIYQYVASILEEVSENVYLMDEPQELTQSDTEDGFIVISLGDMIDHGEFEGESFATVRAYIRCYVPPITRGRLNVELYDQFEKGINAAVKDASVNDNKGKYWIQQDSFISTDMGEDSNANNAYYMFVKSFVVVIDESNE